jgi:F0F1-type ATP synthase membrane subunit b/b'
LEAGRQDLGTWASLLVGVVTLLLAANVGLSVWQVGSMARREATGAIEEYDRRFNGFLTKGEDMIRVALETNERRIAELSRRLSELSARFDKHSEVARETIAELTNEAERIFERARLDSERARAELERELSEYWTTKVRDLDERLAHSSGVE